MPSAGLNGLTRFKIAVPEEQLRDLTQRLKNTRWPEDIGNDDWFYGVNGSYLKDLVAYWIDGFDWKAAEAKLNGYANYRVVLDSVPIHFLHVPGNGVAPKPLIMSHGWPWTYTDWGRVIGPLADPAAFGGDPVDAFDVIVPSLPGYGFSTPLPKPDTNFWKIADLFHRLMTETLGNARYAAAGSDMGALVTGQLGHKYADSLYGIHLARGIPLNFFSGERPWDVTSARTVPAGVTPDIRDSILAYQRRFAAHVAVHVLDSETEAYGLSDSPVGMLAWILHRWRNWSDSHGDVESVFPRDHILTNATIWWATNSIRTSMRTYANAARYPWVPSHDRKPPIEAPVGMTFLGFENPPGVTTDQRVEAFKKSPDAAWYNAVFLKAYETGGHFAPFENPEAIIADIRETFRPLK
jgi:pimeloyl-ACP methyl ester carboxylesterase